MSPVEGHAGNAMNSSRELLAAGALRFMQNKADHLSSSSSSSENHITPVVGTPAGKSRTKHTTRFLSLLRSIFHILPHTHLRCGKLLALPPGPSDHPSLGNRVTGTLFGYRKGHVHFAVQDDPRSPPLLLLQLATPTNVLVKEMASGLVRIALECERGGSRERKLFQEPMWTMFCNGRKRGYAIGKMGSEKEVEVLNMVGAVSMGAGALPACEGDESEEMMYMRATFERVVGSKDSEAFYMMNPDGTGGPELSIFLLRM